MKPRSSLTASAPFSLGGSTGSSSSSNKKLFGSMKKMPRSRSMPEMEMMSRLMIKGILHHRSVDASLSSKYGDHSRCDHSHCNHPDHPNQHIQFKNIEIREYSRIVGDNPSVSAGPPVSIGWEYDPNTKVFKVDDYEGAYEASNIPKRTMSQLALPRKVREDMLKKEWGIPQSQIAGAVRGVIKTKNQRRTTVNNLGTPYDSIQEKMEGATKGVFRSLGLRKSNSAKVEEMEEKSKLAEKQRRQLLLEQTMKDEYTTTTTSTTNQTTPTPTQNHPPSNNTGTSETTQTQTTTTMPAKKEEEAGISNSSEEQQQQASGESTASSSPSPPLVVVPPKKQQQPMPPSKETKTLGGTKQKPIIAVEV